MVNRTALTSLTVTLAVMFSGAWLTPRCAAQARRPKIFVGSAFGLSRMLDRRRWSFVAANADGYYNTWGWSPPDEFPNRCPPLKAAEQAQLVADFAHKVAILESGLNVNPPPPVIPPDETGAHWDHNAVAEMARLGMRTDCALLNDVLPDRPANPPPAASVEQWRAFCDNNYHSHRIGGRGKKTRQRNF